jgi:hypothetical protein
MNELRITLSWFEYTRGSKAEVADFSATYTSHNVNWNRPIPVTVHPARVGNNRPNESSLITEECSRNATIDFKVSEDITKKNKYLDLQQFAAILLPLPSTVFHAEGNCLGNTMENSGKQNPKTWFKPPPSRDAHL